MEIINFEIILLLIGDYKEENKISKKRFLSEPTYFDALKSKKKLLKFFKNLSTNSIHKIGDRVN
jgi:hypothetical protein